MPMPKSSRRIDERHVVRREAAQHRDDRVEDDVQHQRQPAAVAIGDEAEDDRADGPRDEREADGQRDVRPRLAERRRDVLDDERQDEEIERVERPAEKPGEDGVALVGAFGGVHVRRIILPLWPTRLPPNDRHDSPSTPSTAARISSPRTRPRSSAPSRCGRCASTRRTPARSPTALGLDASSTARIYPRIVEKLEREPVEDYRIDFEDGFGSRPDDEEDAVATNGGRARRARHEGRHAAARHRHPHQEPRRRDASAAACARSSCFSRRWSKAPAARCRRTSS